MSPAHNIKKKERNKGKRKRKRAKEIKENKTQRGKNSLARRRSAGGFRETK